ncbi:peptidase S8, partial [Streptomyces spectabilis]
MTRHSSSFGRRALALPLGVAVVSALAFLPGTASAQPDAPSAPAARQATSDGSAMSYVVNLRKGHGDRTAKYVKKAIAKAGGQVVIAYDQIGVIVAHSSDPDFAKKIRGVKGVQSAGATRTAPLSA